PEELDGVLDAELAQEVDPLGGDRQRRSAGREHAEVGRLQHEERDKVGDPVDEVLAVVEDEQARCLPEPLRDPAAKVGALRGRQRAPAADRVTYPESRADLRDDVLRRGDSDELDDVDDRLRRVAREHGASRVLPRPPGPTIETARELASSARSASRSASRPTSDVAFWRTPLRTEPSSASSSRCASRSRSPGLVPSRSRRSRRYRSNRSSAAPGPRTAASLRSRSASSAS